LEIGSRLAHYDVTALIGEGGMGQVYQATDTKPQGVRPLQGRAGMTR
jgi:serine/threonine protein kinase